MAWSEKTGRNSWRVRFRRLEGGIGTVPEKFTSKKAADEYANSLETDQRRGVFIDPNRGQTLLGEWAGTWQQGLDVAESSEDAYRSHLRNQILPRWENTALADITGSAVKIWAKDLRTRYAHNTVNASVKLLRRLLEEAVEERLIAYNPVRPQRRGRRAHSRTPERVWVTPAEALAIADAAARLPHAGVGPLLILTGAWTGARWGELVGLHRDRVHLCTGGQPGVSRIVIDEHLGALHQTSSGLWIGPPKTPQSAREIELPPFLARLLDAHLKKHPHDYVFTNRRGDWMRRDNFKTVFYPAARGHSARRDIDLDLPAIKPGLVFHGLRHSHKTWMIEDLIPDVASEARLGHLLQNHVVRTYSHVGDELRRMILDKLQDRWDKAVAENGTTPEWRAAADPHRR